MLLFEMYFSIVVKWCISLRPHVKTKQRAQNSFSSLKNSTLGQVFVFYEKGSLEGGGTLLFEPPPPTSPPLRPFLEEKKSQVQVQMLEFALSNFFQSLSLWLVFSFLARRGIFTTRIFLSSSATMRIGFLKIVRARLQVLNHKRFYIFVLPADFFLTLWTLVWDSIADF